MEIKEVPIKDLKRAEYNPRIIDKQKRQALKSSMAEFGMLEPLVINTYPGRENVVIGGHQRIEIAEEAKMETIPVVEVDLPREKEMALNIALNKIHGTFHTPKLKRLIQELSKDAPTGTMGFSTAELGNLTAPITIPEPAAFAKVPDGDEPEDTQMTFNLARPQRVRIREAMQHIRKLKDVPTNKNLAEHEGASIVELCKAYLQDLTKNEKAKPKN